MSGFDLSAYGISRPQALRNAPVAVLYEDGVADDELIASSGALIAYSGAKTGRCPKDKRIVEHPDSSHDIWWGPVNIPLSEDSFLACRERAIDFLATRQRLYVVDGFAGWDPRHQLKVRVICARPYHALFMHNMLIRPTAASWPRLASPTM